MKKAQVYEWHKDFLVDRESVNDDPCHEQPSTSTNDKNIGH
jgi:hypothetical protein